MREELSGMRIAILATDMVEESELTEPRQALEDAGAQTHLISPKDGSIVSANHFEKSTEYPVDKLLSDVRASQYDAAVLPGGVYNADQVRMNEQAQKFVQEMDEDGKPIAVICHGAWLLVSAGILDGRTLTSYHSIEDDIINAGGFWLDREVVVDTNIVSSRGPDDIPAFNSAMITLFSSSNAMQMA